MVQRVGSVRSLAVSMARWGLVLATVGAVAAAWRPERAGPTEELAEAEAGPLPGEATRSLIVDFKDDIAPAVLDATPWREEPVSHYSSHDQLYRIRFADEAAAARAAAELRANPNVEAVDWDVEATVPPDEEMAALDGPGFAECAGPTDKSDAAPTRGPIPNDPCFRYQWHLAQVGLPAAWQFGHGVGVTVAVIDTGVSKVPDLAGTEFVPGYNFVGDNDDARDDHGHGTHVAGTIAQATNNKLGVAGVAFGAKIMPLKVLSARGSGSMAAIAQAIRWAADHGAQVVNMSLGGPFAVATIRNAVKYANAKGTVVVAAAGNDGKGRVSYPARYPEVFAVAATQFDEKTTFYSNWGQEVDIAAPGGNVRVDQNGDGKPDGVLQNTVVPGDIGRNDYLWFMGTSMASPHVAGVAALVVGAGVTKPEAVQALLRETARKPKGAVAGGKDRVDDHYGAGIVDAQAALKKAKLGREGSHLALGAVLALAGAFGLRRRGRLGTRIGPGFVAGLVAGASGLFVLAGILPSWLSFATVGVTEAVPALFAGVGVGNPLLLSAALPLLAVGLLLGTRRLRPVAAGLAFGVAGTLAFLALVPLVDVRFVPDLLDRTWLIVNAAVCYGLGVLTLRK